MLFRMALLSGEVETKERRHRIVAPEFRMALLSGEVETCMCAQGQALHFLGFRMALLSGEVET